MGSRKSVVILMADDDADDRLLTREAFDASQVSNELRFVEDGVQLMDYLYNRNQFADKTANPKPGIILLDLNMPKKDGRESLAEIRKDPQFNNIRVIVLTTSKAEEDIYRSYNLGAASYIT